MKRIYLLAALAFIGATHAQENDLQFIENVAVLTTVDGFTDESELLFLIATAGETVDENVPARNISIKCKNGAMEAMMFEFDVYLNNGEYGDFQYRLDGGEVKASERWQSDNSVLLFVSPGGPTDASEVVRDILSGTDLLVRAIGYDGGSDDARYDLTNLKSVMSQIGCSYPQ
jgi:hypothetical protein